jgi:nitrous-oxide reductase
LVFTAESQNAAVNLVSAVETAAINLIRTMSHDQSKAETDAETDSNEDRFLLRDLGVERRDFMKAGMAAGAATSLTGCTGLLGGGGDEQRAASADYEVPPGEHDDYYAFLSGGHSGNIRVYGIPSMRQLMRIPVFHRDSARGHGHDDKSRAMLEDGEGGEYTWGDAHHPRLSQTDGEFDGRWLFIHDKANTRLARVNLKYFQTDAITQLPNAQGIHGLTGWYPDTELVLANSQFRIPVPNDGRNLDAPEEYHSVYTAVEPESMNVEWQVLVDGNLDNSDSGKNGRYAFSTVYNSEEGVTEQEMTADDRDWVIAFDIPRIQDAVENGEYEVVNDVPIVDGRQGSSLNEADRPVTTYIPVPKNPHGVSVTPDGKYACASGKLSPTVSVIDIEAIDEVDDPEDAIVARPNVGTGPLHTAYDGRGHAYTTLFIDSQLAKWDIEEAVEAELGSEDPVIEKIDCHYSPGHCQSAQSYSSEPTGDWLLALNKFSQDRFLPTGPYHPENDQLIYIGDDEEGMQLVKDTPAYAEPHDATIAHRDKIDPADIWDPDDYELDYIESGQQNIEREDGQVYVEDYAIRNQYGFSDITVQEGDEVTLHYTNIETAKDISHSVAIPEYDINLSLAPQETRKVTFTADKPGVFWMYCGYFCSALHMEMRSRLLVEPEDEPEGPDPF